MDGPFLYERKSVHFQQRSLIGETNPNVSTGKKDNETIVPSVIHCSRMEAVTSELEEGDAGAVEVKPTIFSKTTASQVTKSMHPMSLCLLLSSPVRHPRVLTKRPLCHYQSSINPTCVNSPGPPEKHALPMVQTARHVHASSLSSACCRALSDKQLQWSHHITSQEDGRGRRSEAKRRQRLGGLLPSNEPHFTTPHHTTLLHCTAQQSILLLSLQMLSLPG